MSRHRVHCLVVCCLLGVCSEAAAEDWSLTREPRAPARERTARSRHGERAATRAEDRAGVQIDRYLDSLLRDPGQDAAFEKLLDLVRERDGRLDGLLQRLQGMEASGSSSPAAAWLLARVQAQAGQPEAARESFARAVRAQPTSPGPLRDWAALERAANDQTRARELLEQALTLSRDRTQQAELRRELAGLALDAGDFAQAEAHYEASARGSSASAHASGEFARELVVRGEHAKAVAAYRKLIAAQRGDTRGLSPWLLELARAQLEVGDSDGALESLWRARALAAAGSGQRHAIDIELLDMHRRTGRLAALIDGLSHAGAMDADTLDVVGQAHEQLGQSEQALDAYRALLAREPRHVEARQRVIQVLTREGRLDEVIVQYRELLRRAPGDARHVVELAELLLQTGRRAEALDSLAKAARARPRDASLRVALHRLYARWSEPKLAERVLEELVRLEPREASHLIVLGEQQLARGDRAAALATWQRIARVAAEPGRGHATLGELYLDHDLPEEALQELERAATLLPDDPDVARSLAEARERNRDPAGALAEWSRVLESPTSDPMLRREARRRTVQLWAETGALRARMTELEASTRSAGAAAAPATPRELEALRLLAEAHERVGRLGPRGPGQREALGQAERILERLVELAPGDVESLDGLERLRVTRGDLQGALAALEALLAADPRRAKEYLARMARHALALYRDDAALEYARRAVALDPADAEAQRKLGDLYRSAQRIDEAIDSYRRAAAADPHQFGVQLDLAELLIARGRVRDAFLALRAVIRACPDDELVLRAARTAMQLALEPADAAVLTEDMLALALGQPGRAVFRRVLVELYDARVPPLAQQAAAGDVAAAEALRVLGQQGIKPLLGALLDPRGDQRATAIRVLGGLGNAAAVQPLLGLAESNADAELRRQALEAAARVAGPGHAARFLQLTRAPERRLRELATWALARLAEPAVASALIELLDNGLPSIRGHAALGLGRAQLRAERARIERALRSDRSEWVRGSAALALGMLADPASTDALTSTLRADTPPVAAAAALALGQIGSTQAFESLAEAAFSADVRLRRTALGALLRVQPAAPPAATSPIELPAHADLDALLEAALVRFEQLPVSAPKREVEQALARAAGVALRGPVESVRTVLDLLGKGPLLGAAAAVEPEQLVALRSRLLLAIADELRGLGRHPLTAVRLQALRVLAEAAAPAAMPATIAALDDSDASVRALALELLQPGPDLPVATLVPRLATLARSDEAWWMRRRAVAALGRIGGDAARSVLLDVLATDAFAYVRESAAVALSGQQIPGVRAALAHSAASDSEPSVRAAAARALSGVASSEAARGSAPAPGTSDLPATMPQ